MRFDPAFRDLESGQDAQRLCVRFEPSDGRHAGVQRRFAIVAEGRVPEIVSHCDRPHEVGRRQVHKAFEKVVAGIPSFDVARDLVHELHPDLGDLQRVRQARPVQAPPVRAEDLRLALQAAERARLEYALQSQAYGLLRFLSR